MTPTANSNSLTGTESSRLKIVCSCIPGFEELVIAECMEKLGEEAANHVRGRIWFHLDFSELHMLDRLRSVHHYWVVAEEFLSFYSPDRSKEESLTQMYELTERAGFKLALEAWKQFMTNKHSTGSPHQNVKNVDIIQNPKHKNNRSRNKTVEQTTVETTDETTVENTEKDTQNDEQETPSKKSKEDNQSPDTPAMESADAETPPAQERLDYASLVPLEAREALSFRVTCQRKGTHSFSSMEAASKIGAAINDTHGWKVSMKNFDIEVVAHVKNDDLALGIQLTSESQSIRNITHLGPTTLKSNISYCLLRLAQILPGDLVCDPMCGGGSISLEASQGWPLSFQLLGENHPEAVVRAAENFVGMEANSGNNTSLPYSVCQWDVYQLPLRNECMDSIVSDLPFGKKIGNKERNLFMYPNALREMARVTKQGGRIVVLTQHKQAIKKALPRCTLLSIQEVISINMGGMNVSVYVFRRGKQNWTEWLKQDVIEKDFKMAELERNQQELDKNLHEQATNQQASTRKQPPVNTDFQTRLQTNLQEQTTKNQQEHNTEESS